MKSLITGIILLAGAISSAAQYPVLRVSSNTSISGSDTVVILTSTTYVVTLPSCDSGNDGEYHTFRNLDTSPYSSVQISGYSTDTVEGSNFFVDFGQSDTFVCDGPNHNWFGTGYW